MKTFEPSSKPLEAEVSAITQEGFTLRVGDDMEYFMSFDNFPWFRYASNDDIEAVQVWYSNPDDDGEFMLHWPMLDIHIGTNKIAWHSQNPIKRPHPVAYPQSKGKLADRTCDLTECPRHEVEATFTFKGKFTVIAESAEEARRFVEAHCRMQCGGMVVDVHVPFDEIAWDFPWRTECDPDSSE